MINNLPEWHRWVQNLYNGNNGNITRPLLAPPVNNGGIRNLPYRPPFNPENIVPIPNHNPNGPVEIQPLSNRRTVPPQTFSGYYVQPTRNGGQYRDMVNTHAQNYGVDPDLILAIMGQESGGNSRAVSPKGAGGLMQLMPGTASDMGVRNVFDPNQNIMGGTKYIAKMLRRYKGNIEKALWAYNAGPSNADKGRLPAETRKYIPSVMARYRRLKGLAPATPKTATRKRATRRRRARRKR